MPYLSQETFKSINTVNGHLRPQVLPTGSVKSKELPPSTPVVKYVAALICPSNNLLQQSKLWKITDNRTSFEQQYPRIRTKVGLTSY